MQTWNTDCDGHHRYHRFCDTASHSVVSVVLVKIGVPFQRVTSNFCTSALPVDLFSTRIK